METHVSQEDINKGERWNPCKCPVACAMQRHTGASYVAAGCFLLTVDEQSTDTPYEVKLFMHQFDAYGFGNPFTFDLPI